MHKDGQQRSWRGIARNEILSRFHKLHAFRGIRSGLEPLTAPPTRAVLVPVGPACRNTSAVDLRTLDRAGHVARRHVARAS